MFSEGKKPGGGGRMMNRERERERATARKGQGRQNSHQLGGRNELGTCTAVVDSQDLGGGGPMVVSTYWVITDIVAGP